LEAKNPLKSLFCKGGLKKSAVGNSLEFVILDLFGIWCLEFRILFKIRAAKPFDDRRSFKGIYFVRLATDSFKQIEKAILLR